MSFFHRVSAYWQALLSALENIIEKRLGRFLRSNMAMAMTMRSLARLFSRG